MTPIAGVISAIILFLTEDPDLPAAPILTSVGFRIDKASEDDEGR